MRRLRPMLLCWSLAAGAPLPPACRTPPLPDDHCGFYTRCLDAAHPCGPDGYARGYGAKYCHRFDSKADELSAAGDAWLNSTGACLQQALVPLLWQPDATCAQIRRRAFDSHPICYTGGQGARPTAPSICLLPDSDVRTIAETVDRKDALSPWGIEQEARVWRTCVKQRNRTAADVAIITDIRPPTVR